MKIEPNSEATPNGIKSGNRIIGYSAAIRHLDGGKFDNPVADGLRILACIQEAEEAGWLKLSIEMDITLCRWLVVSVFIIDQLGKNGTAEVPNDAGGVDVAVIYSGKNGAITVYPGAERFTLANHIEACAIEKYGIEEGLPLALRMYQDMLEICPKTGFRLSTFGRHAFEMLHDGFIEQFKNKGMPDMPVMH